MKACIVTLAALVVAGALAGSTAVHAQCTGDCNRDGEVTVDELVRGTNIALGSNDVSTCSMMDANSDAEVTIDEIVTAVSLALSGCGPTAPTPTATATQPATQTTPTPPATFVPGCNNGTVRGAFSSPSDTNAETSPANLTLVVAAQTRDPRSGAYLWAITGNTCTDDNGLLRSVQIQLIGPRMGFAPGSYPLTPPLGSLLYVESPATGSVQPRIWQSTGTTLVIDSVSGSTLTFHIDNARMTPNLIVAGDPPPRGSFDLSVTGTIQSVISNE